RLYLCSTSLISCARPDRSLLPSLLLYCSGARRDLHSFPTRRSSDLGALDDHRALVCRRREGRLQGVLRRGRPGLGEEHLGDVLRSEEHTSELQSRFDLVCRLLLEKKKQKNKLSSH